MGNPSPCMYCTGKRNSTCHAECKEYLDWCEEEKKKKEKHSKKKNADDLVKDYMAKTAEQYNKRARKAKNIHGHRR